MTFFGIKLVDDIDLPEFPFPDLGAPEDEVDPPPRSTRGARSRAGALGTGAARRARPERELYH
ncbi:MAG TPA: hypothetical protein VLE23_07770 [Geminicoccaceae bacterium]|nr:hypothetical protein [Geminicoccaceae bacterium]